MSIGIPLGILLLSAPIISIIYIVHSSMKEAKEWNSLVSDIDRLSKKVETEEDYEAVKALLDKMYKIKTGKSL